MKRRGFLASLACCFSLLGVRKEANKSVIRKFDSLKDEWRGMVAGGGSPGMDEWWYTADITETDRDGKVTMTAVFRKLNT